MPVQCRAIPDTRNRAVACVGRGQRLGRAPAGGSARPAFGGRGLKLVARYNFRMTSTIRLEAELLGLPAPDRERLALLAWDSLENDPAWLANPTNDSEGIALATARDSELTSGKVVALTHEEFLRRRAVSANEA